MLSPFKGSKLGQATLFGMANKQRRGKKGLLQRAIFAGVTLMQRFGRQAEGEPRPVR
jgi:hypothetical protein